MVKASVIIPTKNPGVIFKQVLPAVLEQQTPWPFDVLVIDSGSSDGTVEYIQGFDKVRLHQIPPEEYGHGKTRNLGISMTEGEFAVMLTHDALPYDAHWLHNLIDAMGNDPDVAGAFGRHMAYPDADPFTKRNLELHFNGFTDRPVVAMEDDPERYAHEEGYRQFMHFFSDNNSCLRRSVWEKHPYPDVDFAEDQIWAKTIIEAGYKKTYAHDAVVYHSHSFGPWEHFRRSFDESYAFLRLFGYKLSPSLLHAFGRMARQGYADSRYALSVRGIGLSGFYWTLRAVLDNIGRHLGTYMGQRAKRFPGWLLNIISRDRSLKNS